MVHVVARALPALPADPEAEALFARALATGSLVDQGDDPPDLDL